MKRRGHNEGSIYKRGDGRWAASMSVPSDGGKPQRKTFYGKTRREVQEKLTAALRDLQQGMIPATGASHSVASFLTRWLEDVVRPTVRISTYVRYRSAAQRHIFPALGTKAIAKLTPEDIQSLYAQLISGGFAPRTVYNVHLVIHRALDYAVRWHLVQRNVSDLVELPRARRPELRVLTVEQARALMAAVQADPLEALYVLAITTGMRRGELLGLRWSDIDLTAGTLQVKRTLGPVAGYGYLEHEPKSERGRRSIRLTPQAIEALQRHQARQLAGRLAGSEAWQDTGRVFCGPVGQPLSITTLYRSSYRPLLTRAGIPRMRFHDLRHSAATLLLSLGVHPKIVQELLGHSQVSITLDVYSHVLPNLQEEAVARLGGLLANEHDPGAEKHRTGGG